MDPSDLVYVVATDDDLPLSLQLARADGTLQPCILPKSSLPCGDSCDRAITVYDAEGNDVAEDVTIDEFEYVVDENGEVFHLTNTKPNMLASLNCLVSVNAAGCTKSLMSGDVSAPNMEISLKMHSAQMSVCSPSSSHKYLHNMQSSCQAYDKTKSSTTATVEFSQSPDPDDISVNGCGNCTIESSFPISAVALAVQKSQNAETVSVFCEKNPLSVCVNSSTSSNDLQTGNCSVPSSPESLCHGTRESVSEVDLTASHNSMATSDVSACLQSVEKYTTVLTDTTNSDMNVASGACDMSPSDVARCDIVSNSTVQLFAPCVSISANCCSVSCSREGSCVCQQSSDQSESNCVSTSHVLDASSPCDVRSPPNVVFSFTSDKPEANSALCMHSSQPNAPVTDCAANGNTDSSECQVVADCLLADSCDSSKHSISSHSPITELSSCGVEQHSAESIATVNVTDISAELRFCGTEQHSAKNVATVGVTDTSPSDMFVSAVTTSTPDHCDANDCCQVDTIHNCTDALPVDAERAEQCISETEKPSSHDISDSLNSSSVDCPPLTSDCDNAVDEFGQQKIDIAVASPSDKVNVNGLDARNDCSSESVDAERAEQCISETEKPSSHDISDSLNSSSVDCPPLTSDCDNAVDEFGQQKIDITVVSPSDKANVNGLDAGSDCSSELDAVGTVASKTSPVLEPSDAVGQIVQDEVQKFTDTVADAECQLQAECTANYTFNGCQRDLLEAVDECSSNIHRLKQRLRALHRTKCRLMKLRQNNPPPICARNTNLDVLCDIDCKRLRLEAIDQELADRQLSLRHKEEQMDMRLLSVERREQVARVTEQLLARSCCFSPQLENPEVSPSSHFQLLPKLQSVDPKSDILEKNCRILRKRTAQWHKPYLLRKKKVFYTFTKNSKLDLHCVLRVISRFCEIKA